MSPHSLCSLAVAFGLACFTCTAPSASAAGLLIADGGLGGVLEIREQDVRVTINNGIAVTEIDQTFVNTEPRIVEALYTFPVPKGASVSNFSMWIEGKEMIGEVVERERARQIYESYKEVRRDPGLLEQVDYKRFEMRIFPIPAGAEQRVKVTYYQELDFDHNWATYVYPLATVTRSDIDQRTQGHFSVSMDIKSEIPIAEIESTSHGDDFVTAEHTPHYAQAAMELAGGELSRDVVVSFRTERERTGVDLVNSRPSGEDGYFLMTLTPGSELAELAEPMDYVFVLDVSGSMARDGKLATSRQSLGAFIDSLGPEDRFETIAFNLAPQPLFRELRAADADSLQQAATFLDAQRARGSTVLRPAIQAAYSYRDSDRPLNVVLLSDGMTEPSEQAELLKLISGRPSGVRVFCIGVGNEVNRPLLEQMARDAGGVAAFVSQEDSFTRQAQLFRQKLVRPAIEDVTASFAGGGVHDVEPRELGDLFYGVPLRLYGRYGKPGVATVTLSGTVQGAPWSQSIDIELPEAEGDNPEIERMWASRRVDRLLGEERRGTNHQAEIVGLCEGYSITSIYASMLVLENDAEYKRWKIDRRNAIRVRRDRAARDQLQQQLVQLRRQNEQRLVTHSDNAVAEDSSSRVTPANQAGTPQQPVSDPANRPVPQRGSDIEIPSLGGRGNGPGGAGGGAIDPLTGLAVLLTVGGAAAATRRRRDA